MVHRMLIMLGTGFFLYSFTLSASQYYGFCWGKNSEGTFCTDIEDSAGPLFMAKCTQWAKSLDYFRWGNYKNTDFAALEKKHLDVCVSGLLSDFQCNVVTLTMGGGGVASSIAIVGTVKAANLAHAAKRCLDKYKAEYDNALLSCSNAMGGGCHVQLNVN